MMLGWNTEKRVVGLGQTEAEKAACKEACAIWLLQAPYNPAAIFAAIACQEACLQGASSQEMGKAADAAAEAAKASGATSPGQPQPPPEPRASPTEKYPWKVYSSETVALQTQLNEKLKALGFCPIGTDGKLGPATCGAADAVWPQMKPKTCVSMTAPKKPPCVAARAPKPTPEPTPTPTVVAATEKAAGTSPWAILLGLALFLGIVVVAIPKTRSL